MAEYTDNFSQADENPLSSGGVWDTYAGIGNLQAVGNKVRAVTLGGADSFETYNGFTPGNDQFAQITISTWNATTNVATIIAGVFLRAAAPSTHTAYRIQAQVGALGASPIVQLSRINAGVNTDLTSASTSFVAGDILTGMIRGSTMFAFKNSTLIASFTDGTPIASGRIGAEVYIGVGGSLTDVEIDDFVGGDIRKTRFYLPNTGAAEISPAFTLESSWTATTNADRITMVRSRISSTMATKAQAAPGTAGGQKWLFRQYVSKPLAAGDVFGALFGQIRGLESAANDNIDAISLKVLVVKADATLRGTLLALANYGTVAELATSLRNKIIANGDGLTKVTALDGDRIVAEIGLTNTANGTSVSGSLSFGDDSATDLAEDEAATAANNPWLEFVGVNLMSQLLQQGVFVNQAVKRASYY